MQSRSAARCGFRVGTALAALAFAQVTPAAHAVVPNETTDSEEIVDEQDEFRGVGLFFRADGGVCTGTLINPRTVLFAAHCVNDLPATDYDTDTLPAAWAFDVDAVPGILNWFQNGFASNPGLAVFNVNRVYYDPRSTQDSLGLGFFEADIAIASLDTPAARIPTWALLFSTLPAPAIIDPVRGTGYQVDIVGYGATGNAIEGAVDGIDLRRRAAENLLGGFFSLDDQDNALLGPGSESLPQNLYQLDFDSQDGEAFFDINVTRDDALPNEGITAGGDSGGPLILDAASNTLAAEDLVIGVLSGGGRLFESLGQEFSTLGTTSFYQPLSLYWQYIVATNPYRYVGARAGDGAWEDPGHWETQLDPVYRVIDAQGRVVNGLPTTPELAREGTGGDFGAICFEIGSPDDSCTDLATGTTGGASAAALPAPTLANGLPGATGFVPDNIDPVVSADPAVNVDPRYYDVTLREAGTTTLGSAITIDRLTVAGAGGLRVTEAGSLTTLIDVSQFGGRVSVDGGIASAGDYTLFAGVVEGTGTIAAPFLTSITGVLAPGTVGSTGTLTIDGNLVLASGSVLDIDIAPGGVSDRVAVTGIADVGGIVNVRVEDALRASEEGETYTIVTANEGITGTFSDRALSGVLRQQFAYEDDAVLMEIMLQSYTAAIDPDDPVQGAYAILFDQNRGNDALDGLYALDLASAEVVRSTFTGLAPVGEQAVLSLAGQSLNLLQNASGTRLREADRSSAGGKVTVTGRPLELAGASLAPAGQPLGSALMALQGSGETATTVAALPENLGIFLSGGFVAGEADSLPGFTGETDLEGYFISGGIEFYPGESTMLGLAAYFNALEADTPLGQRVDTETYAASLYLRHAFQGGPVIDGQFSMGSIGFDTRRSVQFLGASQALTSYSDDLLVSAALGVSYDLATGIGTFSPGVEARYASVDLGAVRESGGTLALAIDRANFTSTQARVGIDFEKRGTAFAVNANAQLVREFEDGPQLLAANFAQGAGPNANFVLDGADRTWAEAGLSLSAGEGPLRLSLGADTTIGRTSAEAHVVRGTATWRF